MSSVNIENLKTGYNDTIIINDLEIKFKENKISSIIGSNGCGKSTLLKSIGRILKPKNGVVYINGESISKKPTKVLAREMAILPQTPSAPYGITVFELVSYGRFPHNSKLNKEDIEITKKAIKITGLQGFEDRSVDSLSGGQKQRVWIAMAICQQTDIILLDEPTTYLDMAYQLEVLLLLKELNEKYNTTIIMVLHDLNLASRVSHELIAMRDGSIVKSGTPEEVMTKETLREVYDIDANLIYDEATDTKVCLSYTLISKDRNIKEV
ncbi:MAG: ABC transporter ATP-binding protein [Lachnospirales bacterium]